MDTHNISGHRIISMVQKSAHANNDSIALIHKKSAYTYNQLLEEIKMLTGQLCTPQFRQESPIGLFFKNSPEFVIGYYSLISSGIITMLVDHSWKAAELANVSKDCHLGGFLVHTDEADSFCRNNIEFEKKFESGTFALVARRSRNIPLLNKNKLENIVSCRFSSGTTGTPKCMMYDADNIIAAATNWKNTIQLGKNDRVLCLANFTHGLAFNTSMLAPISEGATLVTTDSLMPRHVAELIERERITILVAFPVFFSLMAEENMNERHDLSSLRLCVSSGTILHSEIKAKFKKNIGIRIADLYGVAETGLCILNNTDNFESIGKAITNVEITIMDDDGKSLPQGAEGQIAIKSKSMAKGYYNVPGAFEKRVTADGFYLSGDIGFIDEQGEVYVIGRKTDFVDVAGKKVDPKEVENILLKMAGIRDVAIFSQSSERTRTEVLCAAISVSQKLDREDVMSYAQQNLASYKVPQRIFFLDELPRNSSGKVLRSKLASLRDKEPWKTGTI